METNVGNDALGQAIHGYSRAEVDDFLQAAAAERARLEREIVDSRGRIGRARSAIGMHRVMVSMLLETQRELTELRQDAEARAEQIVTAAEHEAAAILGGTPPPTFATAPDTTTPRVIDLGAGEHNGAPQPLGAYRSANGDAPTGSSGQDEYFDFLRGALADESPLGPGPE
jgi:hypothetical protein